MNRKHPLKPVGRFVPAFLLLLSAAHADTIAYWNFNSLAITPPAPPGTGSAPSSLPADTGSGTLLLTGYAGNLTNFGGTTQNAVGNAPQGQALALQTGGTAAPFPGNGTYVDVQVSLEDFENPILTYATQKSGTGYGTQVWSYSTGGAFTAIPGGSIVPPGSFATQTLDLSAIDVLDGAVSVTLRCTFDGGTANNGNNRFDNLHVSATPVGGDTTPPTIATLTPSDNAVDVSVDGLTALFVSFSEDITTTTGNILVKKVSDGSVVNTIDVSDLDQIEILESLLTIKLANPLEANTAYYVEIPSGAITDVADTPNAFAGISGPTAWNFTTAAPPTPPTVVINKYSNGAPDRVELLVIGNGTSGSTVDLRGMILKDYSSDGGSDNGGSYTFSNHALWSAVRAGTLIALPESGTAADTDALDYILNVGLQNETYFDVSDGSGFDIAGSEVLMIKASGSLVDGNAGAIHAIAGGVLGSGSFFETFTGPKVKSTLGAATNEGVRVKNSTSTLADYVSGTDAEGGVTLLAGDFGAPNSNSNALYIAALRGLAPGDGEGFAFVTNITSGSPFENLGFFDKNQSAQVAKVTINAQSSTPLANITIAVPASLGTPAGATLAGSGAGSASISLVGQTITITGAAVTQTNALEVTITGLTTPAPSLVTENGNYPLVVSTSATGGTLTPIGNTPAVRVITPIASFRDVDAAGISLDSGMVVAVEGIVTEEDFGNGTSNYSGFIQDSTAGINIFSPTNDPGLVRGHRVAVLGTVTQFNGLTEIIPTAATDVVDLGTATEPAPQVVSLADLLAAAESYEGSLVTVQNLEFVSGTWANTNAAAILSQGSSQIGVYVAAGSTATTEPAYPVTITGIFSQRDTNMPLTAGYQLQPRTQDDLVPGTGGGESYSDWAATNGIAGEPADGDFDHDGLDNLMEYALGSSPTAGSSTPGTLTSGVLSFPKGADAFANDDVVWSIQTSTNLTDWDETTETSNDTSISIPFVLAPGQAKIFARLVVTEKQ